LVGKIQLAVFTPSTTLFNNILTFNKTLEIQGGFMSIFKVIISIGLILSCTFTFAKSGKDVDKALNKLRNFAVTSFNNKDIDAVMSTWHKDGVLVGRFGSKADVISGEGNIRAYYLSDFASPHFMKISMKSETINVVNGVYIDSGTLSFLESDGSIELTGCYVMAFVQVGDSFKAINEFFYPFCMPSEDEH